MAVQALAGPAQVAWARGHAAVYTQLTCAYTLLGCSAWMACAGALSDAESCEVEALVALLLAGFVLAVVVMIAAPVFGMGTALRCDHTAGRQNTDMVRLFVDLYSLI